MVEFVRVLIGRTDAFNDGGGGVGGGEGKL